MASIIEKSFDVSKNIVRTIFLGKPNLFTTSDLNRQIEAFKYQMNSIEDRLGAESDMEISLTYTDNKISCKVTKGTYFKVNGLSIPLPSPSDEFSMTSPYGQEVYFYVYCSRFVRKTYANDTTHEIAGAKFTDGTSMPSADQLVLGEVYYAITDDLGDLTRDEDDFAFLIAKMNYVSSDDKYIHLNYKPSGDSVMLDSSYSLSHIEKLKNQVSPISLSSGSWKQSAQGDILFHYRIYHGMLHIICSSVSISLVASSSGSYLGASGSFDSEDAIALATHFTKLGYSEQSRNLVTSDSSSAGFNGIFIPIGRGSVSGTCNLGDGSSYKVFGTGEYGLYLAQNQGEIYNVELTSYISNVVRFNDTGVIKDVIHGPVNRLSIANATFSIEPGSIIIPLSE